MNKQSGMIRRKAKGFAQISNIVLRDKKLSLKAKGLYSLIESYLTLDNWVLYKDYLMKQCQEKETAFNGAWKELKDNGYLIQYKLKDKETGKWVYEYELLDEPAVQVKEEPKKPHPENPGVENPPVGNPHVENQGVYNNTDLNNTDLNNTDRKLREGEPSFPVLSEATESNVISLEDKKVKPTPAIIPDECINDLDKYFIGRFKKERTFYGINFDEGLYYNAFADALLKTQLQDSVEVLTMNQYPYFIKTLKNMIEPLETERKLLGW